jgi:hypothetical protein
MNKKLFILIALTAGLCACSNDDDKQLQEESAPVRKISIEVTENPLVANEGSGSAASTRGSVIYTSSLSAFSMNYQTTQYNIKYDIIKNNNGWTPNPIDWPVIDDTPITFRAYNGGTYIYQNDYLSFTLEESASNQIDLLVATKTVSYDDANGKVSLTFDHACAAVDFQIRISNTLRNALGTDLAINSIKLINVKNHGRYNYSTGWSDLSGSASYTLTSSDFSLGTELQTLNCGTLFMIPQTLGDGVGLSIDYTINTIKYNTIVNLEGEWEAGIQYTAKVKLGKDNVIVTNNNN